jgi:hypothetical protein
MLYIEPLGLLRGRFQIKGNPYGMKDRVPEEGVIHYILSY